MNNLTYQQIFLAFNACGHDPEASISARNFEIFSSTPENTLKALDLAKSLGSQRQLQYHKTTFLRGLTTALHKNQWQPKHAKKLIAATDWLISLNTDSAHANRYTGLLRVFTNLVQHKVPVPATKRTAWAKALEKKKSAPKSFRPFYSPEIVCERPFKNAPHTGVWVDERG